MSEHPVQVDLQIRVAGLDVARKRVEDLKSRQRDAHNRAHELSNQVGEARDLVRTTAGAVAAGEGSAKDAQAARKALRDLESESEIAEIELAGIIDRVTTAEEELGLRRREMARTGEQLVTILIALAEEKARITFTRFAAAMRERHRLARLAVELATTAAGGRYSEPFDCSSPRCGANVVDLDTVLHQYGLTPELSPEGGFESATLSDILEAELPRHVEAAE